MITIWMAYGQELVGGGAVPFLVGGVICLVNSDNERDSSLLNRPRHFRLPRRFLEGQAAFQPHEKEQ